jgi:hypothetical protein
MGREHDEEVRVADGIGRRQVVVSGPIRSRPVAIEEPPVGESIDEHRVAIGVTISVAGVDRIEETGEPGGFVGAADVVPPTLVASRTA